MSEWIMRTKMNGSITSAYIRDMDLRTMTANYTPLMRMLLLPEFPLHCSL